MRRTALFQRLYHTLALSKPCLSGMRRPHPYLLSRSPSLLVTNRSVSGKRVGLPQMLSDVEEYVAQDFTLSDLQRKLDEEVSPVPITKQSVLKEANTVDAVLVELSESISTGTLKPDEIVLYFNALVRQKSVLPHNDHQDYKGIRKLTGSNIYALHDDPHFQILIREAIAHSARLPTNQLAAIFAAFVKLDIPPVSNAMLLLTACIQERINEFFPSDVGICVLSIRALEKTGINCMEPLRDGFVMHLENQLLDQPTFNKILQSTIINHRLVLLRLLSKYMSEDLKIFLTMSISETILKRPKQELRSKWEAERLLQFLSRLKLPKRFLFNTVSRYFAENPHELNEDSEQMLGDIEERFRDAMKVEST